MSETTTIELTQDEASVARLSIDYAIVAELELYKVWNEKAEKLFIIYRKLNGYFEKETFEKLAWGREEKHAQVS